MEKSRLISIAEHSDWLENKYNNSMTKWRLHRLRVDFGKQPLEPWQFVPCKLVDGVWAVLEEKKPFQDNYHEFVEAKERCLFEGFKSYKKEFVFLPGIIEIDGEFCDGKTIEDLVKYNLQLTQTAQKQIGL